MRDCQSCKHNRRHDDGSPCMSCILYDLWEQPALPLWSPVSEPPEETTFVLISFKEPITDNLVSTGWYTPHSNRWAIVDEELAEYTPEFYIPIKDLNIPQNRETKH